MISFKIYRPTIRAYYRDISWTDLSLPHNTGRSVSQEKLQALGIKFWKLKCSVEEYDRRFRNLGEEMGFRVDSLSKRYFESESDQVENKPESEVSTSASYH